MRLAEWRMTTANYLCSQHRTVLCVVLPFMELPGICRRVAPIATLHFVSAIPRADAELPDLQSVSCDDVPIPLLNLHTDLVKAYWAASKPWGPWQWMEMGFNHMRREGFVFRRNNLIEYSATVAQVAARFACYIQCKAEEVKATCLLIYGRGHWSMNAAVAAADRLRIPVFVLERGILPDTYIVDLGVPFPALDSRFRHALATYADVDDPRISDTIQIAVSRHDLYYGQTAPPKAASHSRPNGTVILAGQCMFDFNCLNAPFQTPGAFVEFAMAHCPREWDAQSFVYRPHPLSPEEYVLGSISTACGDVPIDHSPPKELLSAGIPICSWNSTLAAR